MGGSYTSLYEIVCSNIVNLVKKLQSLVFIDKPELP